MQLRKSAPTLALLTLLAGVAFAATPDQPVEQDPSAIATASFWSFNGGEATLRFNTSFLDLFDIAVQAPGSGLTQREHDAVLASMSIAHSDGIQFSASRGSLDRFVGGLLRVDGAFSITLPDGGTIAYDGFQLRVSQRNPMHLELVGADGQVWLYVNHLMWELVDDGQGFALRAADLRASDALAVRAGLADLAGAYVGELKFTSAVRTRGTGQMGVIDGGGTPNFHGDPFPGGGIYEADVLMQNYSMSFSRCRSGAGSGSCDGNGPDNGQVVFTPSSTLRNTNNPNTADVPWYRKFTGNTNPYGYPYPNADQHPYLTWNLYRIVDGQLEQIAASGLKHAWLTTNGGCSAPFGGHILSPNCTDTYGTGNNDAPQDLGPRNELVASTGYWGRCGSIFDTNCDGSSNQASSDGYRDRLVVRESQLSTPGAQYFSDSWYVVQDDINIYNTMMHKTMAPAAGGSSWTPGSEGPNVVGPVINAWVSPTANPTRNVEIDDEEGHTRIAVKVKTLASCPTGSGLSGTCYRYDYAVHNFDFARAVYGAPPNDLPPNLRVVDNRGFASFTIPVAGTAVFLEANHFADIDIDAGNNWVTSFDANGLTWTAPAGNELNWGTLYRFSLVTNVAPDDGFVDSVELGVAAAGTPSSLQVAMMVPNTEGAPPGNVVTATAGTGGSIAPPSQVVADGGTASFTVAAQTGFSVASVTGSTCTPVDNGGGSWSAANITAACAVTASFVANTYTVTASAGTGGSITPSTQTVSHGSAATFTVTRQTGFSIASVTGTTCTPVNTSGTTWSAPNITSACAVTATFVPSTYTVTATGGTGGSITPPSQTVTHGSAAGFTVVPQTGFSVASVTGSTCTPVNTGGTAWSAANITAACAVTATFAANTYTVTASAGTGGSITPPNQSVTHGGSAQFAVTAQPGFAVATVTGTTCTPTSNGNGTWSAANITSACAVSATFAVSEYIVTASAGVGGSITPPSQSVAAGGDAEFTVSADPQYDVLAVTGDTCTPVDNGDGTWTASNITTSCAVTASFMDRVFYSGFEGPPSVRD